MAAMPPEPPEQARRRSFAGLVVEDIRSVRRWLAILGALAVIATALAVYALLQEGESADRSRVNQLERRLMGLERRASEESDVSRLERRARTKAEERDVRRLGFQLSRLDRRLRRVEGDVVDAVDAAAGAGRGISSLQDRVTGIANRLEDVEDRPRRGRD